MHWTIGTWHVLLTKQIKCLTKYNTVIMFIFKYASVHIKFLSNNCISRYKLSSL